MGKVLTVMNMKGGVGKTTVATHVAGGIARFVYGDPTRRVLAIDYDPQFNLSQAYIPAAKYFALEQAKKTTLSIFIDDDIDIDPFDIQLPGNHKPPNVSDLVTNIYSFDQNSGLDILPATLDLMYLALGKADQKTKPFEERFEKFINEARKLYALIVIDCHPAGSLFTKTSLRNSDHVLIPVMPKSSYAVRGIGLMMDFIEATKVGNKGPTPHILFNGTSRKSVSAEETQIRALGNIGPHCMKATLKRFKAFSVPEGGRGFVWTSTRSYSTQALANLHQVNEELVVRIGI